MIEIDDAQMTVETLTERAAATLERAILNGDLAPGAKLRIPHLVRDFGISATPIREGLSRLVAKGYVAAVGQRGFRVTPIGPDDLQDLVRTRALIEEAALRAAIARGDDEWEARVVAALHRLGRVMRADRIVTAADFPRVDTIHKAFHIALISACASPRLIELHNSLYDQTYRYRRLMFTSFENTDKVIEEHRQLADLALAREADAAAARIGDHLNWLVTTYAAVTGPKH